MMETTFSPVKEEESINQLAQLAEQVWHECYCDLLSNEQIDYMIDKFQSVSALSDQIADGYQYYLVEPNCGYFGFKIIDNKLFLSKLYLKVDARGKGIAGQIISFITKTAVDAKCQALYLTVNKYNAQAIAAYEHYGFQKTADVVSDIGSGYVMDDYVMEKQTLYLK